MIALGQADARRIPLRSASVQCVVTSPPYWRLRDYEAGGQIGLERTPDQYVRTMVGVFREVRRVLREDGIVWLNLGDSYGHPKLKDLAGIPWRVAFALQADGWWLRSDVVWHKAGCLAESVKDRPTKVHEYVFLFTKRARYYYDVDAVREPHKPGSLERRAYKMDVERERRNPGSPQTLRADQMCHPAGRNKRSVWRVPTSKGVAGHFATFPVKLVEPMVLAGSAQGDVVLDPFGGAMTVGLVCAKHGRRFVGLDLKREYVQIGASRLEMGKRAAWECGAARPGGDGVYRLPLFAGMTEGA